MFRLKIISLYPLNCIAVYIIWLSLFSKFSLSFFLRGYRRLLHPISPQILFCTRPIAFDDFGTQIGELDELDADPYADPWRLELNHRINRQRWKKRLIERGMELRELTRNRRLSGGDGLVRNNLKDQLKSS
jgi:hypothetical protein